MARASNSILRRGCKLFILLGVTLLGSAAAHAESYTGWWWQGESKTGTGISIEQQAGRLYLAWYVFDETGRPAWYSALMDGAGNNFAGPLFRYSGWPLETDFPADGYTGESIGTVNVAFTSLDEGTLTYNDGDGHAININRFMSGTTDSRDIQGWWWDQNHGGMGVFIESRGGQLFAAWYHYRDDHSPRWWITINDFVNTATSYSGDLFQYAGGQTLTGEWTCPSLNSAKGPVSIQFQDETATLQWQGFSYDLERFQFSAPPAAKTILPDTGITQCYDDFFSIIPCPSPGEPFYGQDAQYTPPPTQPSYLLQQHDYDEDTVTDNVTGLMWMRSDEEVQTNWHDAISYCVGLTYGGHSDWRLPDRHELFSILDFGRSGLAIDPVFSGYSERYWSSNPSADNSDNAWAVHFNDGSAFSDGKGNTYYVRCVRSGL